MINVFNIVRILILGIFLLIEGVRDIKQKKISIISVMITSVLGIFLQIPNIADVWLSLTGGVIVGIIFLIISKLTKEKIGCGDGWVMLTAGICLGFRGVICLLSVSLFIASVFSIVLLLFKKVGRKTELPFVGFMIPGYVLSLIML